MAPIGLPEIAVPRPWPPLFGRDADLAGLRARRCDPWVQRVTLTGCPGVGKSALALERRAAAGEPGGTQRPVMARGSAARTAATLALRHALRHAVRHGLA